MGLAPHRLIHEDSTDAGLVVRSALPVELALKVQQSRATFIFADEIVVRGTVATAGQDLHLYCRVLRFEEGGSVDASGPAGLPSFLAEQRPEAAREPGTDGADGAAGGAGGHGGAVHIVAECVIGRAVVRSCGGVGGRGQDGGHGRTGRTGANGANMATGTGYMPPAATGGQGWPGGRAGLPGRPGKGGDGGTIAISLLTDLAGAAVESLVERGAAGAVAQPGLPGDGGEGGPGGIVTYTSCVMEPGGGMHDRMWRISEHRAPAAWAGPFQAFEFHSADAIRRMSHAQTLRRASDATPLRRTCSVEWERQAPTGPRGPLGDARAAEVAECQQVVDGRDGTATLAQPTLSQFAAASDALFLDLLTAQIEDEFRMAGTSVASTLQAKIEFWSTVAEGGTAEQTEVLARLYSLGRKLMLGLDVYGYSRERVPLLAFDTYQRLVSDIALNTAQQIERAYLDYWNQANDREASLRQLDAAVRAAVQRTEALDKERERVDHEARQLLASLPGMDAKVEAASIVLMERYDELNDAIRAKTEGCDLIGALGAVVTIVAGVSTGGAGFIAAASAGATLYDRFTADGADLDTLWDQRAILQKDLKKLAKGANDVGEAIKKIRDAVGELTPEQRKLPQFVVERQQFDEIAAQYAELPEAQEYKEAGYHYLKCVETRNQAIVDYNALLAQWVSLQAMAAASQRAERLAQDDLGARRDLSQGYVMTLMTRLYVDALGLAGQMVHAEGKALGYLLGRPAEVRFSTLNAASIAKAHADLARDWVAAKEQFRPRRELEPGALVFSLRQFVTSTAWATFLEHGILSFTLRRDHPVYQPLLEHLPGLRMTGLSLKLAAPEASPHTQQLGWSATQMGHEALYPQDRAVHFSHNPVTVQVFTPFDDSRPILTDDFSEHDLYAGMSPFASWLLECSPKALQRLGQIDDVLFGISGYIVEGTARPVPIAADLLQFQMNLLAQ